MIAINPTFEGLRASVVTHSLEFYRVKTTRKGINPVQHSEGKPASTAKQAQKKPMSSKKAPAKTGASKR